MTDINDMSEEIPSNTSLNSIYIVISFDVIDSKTYKVETLDDILDNQLNQLNKVLENKYGVHRKFCSSRGDEIQIIMPLDEGFAKIIMLSLSYLRPLKLRFGMGVGEYGGEFKENSWDMNGDIFVYARNQLENLKKVKKYMGLVESNQKQVDSICNNIMYVTAVLLNKITEKQWEVIRMVLANTKTEEILEKLNISSSSFYERLATSNLKEILSGFQAISEILELRGV